METTITADNNILMNAEMASKKWAFDIPPEPISDYGCCLTFGYLTGKYIAENE